MTRCGTGLLKSRYSCSYCHCFASSWYMEALTTALPPVGPFTWNWTCATVEALDNLPQLPYARGEVRFAKSALHETTPLKHEQTSMLS